MSRFIKLTNMALNSHDINRIIISPNKYIIHINQKKSMDFGGELDHLD